jgi:hypothetical protein
MAIQRLAIFELDKHGMALSRGKQAKGQLDDEPSAFSPRLEIELQQSMEFLRGGLGTDHVKMWRRMEMPELAPYWFNGRLCRLRIRGEQRSNDGIVLTQCFGIRVPPAFYLLHKLCTVLSLGSCPGIGGEVAPLPASH